jgi:hypothetical protein
MRAGRRRRRGRGPARAAAHESNTPKAGSTQSAAPLGRRGLDSFSLSRWPRIAALAIAALGAGCVSVIDDKAPLVPDVPTTSVVIPIGQPVPPGQEPLVEFYGSLLERMHEAHKERDLATLQQLLAEYRRADAPSWVQERFAGYAALAMGLAFERHVATAGRLERVALPPPPGAVPAPGAAPGGEEIGEAVQYEVVVPPMPGQPVRLGGRDDADPVAFAFAIEITDEFVDGSLREDKAPDLVRLPATVVLGDSEHQEPLRLPVRLAFGDTGGVRRTLSLAVDLVPGHVGVAGERAPVRRTRIASVQFVQWPRGFQPIREKPLAALARALQLGDAAHFTHVRLAAEFAPPEQRAEVEKRLIDWVRLGRPDQARVAMAALHALGVASVPIGDRDGWLAWWQARR